MRPGLTSGASISLSHNASLTPCFVSHALGKGTSRHENFAASPETSNKSGADVWAAFCCRRLECHSPGSETEFRAEFTAHVDAAETTYPGLGGDLQ
jgi:hypothetical protein